MSWRGQWREGETRIISVTPVSHGVWRPLLLTITTAALVVEAASRYSIIHRVEDWLLVVLVLPLAIVTLTRTWRWRSHKVYVTNARVVVEGGIMRHYRTSVEMRDVLATRIDQRMSERLARRGYLYLETAAGPILVGLVRHPAALCRLIDAERVSVESFAVPLDTVFTYEDPDAYQLEVRPDEWQRRRLE